MAACVAVDTAAWLPQLHKGQESKEGKEDDDEDVDSAAQRRRQRRRYRLRIVQLSDGEEEQTVSSTTTNASECATAAALSRTVGSSRAATVQAACVNEQDSKGDLLDTAPQHPKKRRRLRRMQPHDEGRVQPSALAGSNYPAAIHTAAADTAVQLHVDHAGPGNTSGTNKFEQAAAASTPTWTARPTRDAYLAAKVEAWRAADVGSTTPSPPPTTERPLTPVDELDLSTTAQREHFFVKLVQDEMKWHGLLPK